MTHSHLLTALRAPRAALLTAGGDAAVAPVGDTSRPAPSDWTGAGPMPLGPLVSPGYAKRTRAALPNAVRVKLDALETDAETAHSRLLVLSERARTVRDEEQRLARHLEMLRANPTAATGSWVPSPADGPRARVWVPAPDDDVPALERDLLQTTADVERLTAERDVAQTRWNTLGRIAERCRAYLGL